MKKQTTIFDFTGNEPALNALKIIGAPELYQSLCITGDFATGKDKLAQEIYNAKILQNKVVEILSWRRNCADPVKGKTIENFFELPTIGLTSTVQISVTRFSDEKKELLRKIDTIIINEASTVPGQILNIIDYILRMVRKGINKYSDKVPFGNVQMVFIGDPFVYSPFALEDTNGKKISQKYFFESSSFKKLEPLFINLENNTENVEPRLREMMRKIRIKNDVSEVEQQIRAIINHNKKFAHPFIMRIVRAKEKAIALNKELFEETVISTTSATPPPLKYYRRSIVGEIDDPYKQIFEPHYRDYQRGQVMFFHSSPGKYRAGEIGYDVCIKGEQCTMKNMSGDVIEVYPYTITNEIYANPSKRRQLKCTYARLFFPFLFCFASTIYATHNLTFRFLEFQLGGKRMPGHLHIALTRCTSLRSLMFSNSFGIHDILVPDVVYEFDEMIRSEQQAARLQEVLDVIGNYQ